MSFAKRATVYFEPKIHKALRLKAAETDRTLSDWVNQAVSHALAEDAIDLEAIATRRKESSRSFESFLKELKRDGLI